MCCDFAALYIFPLLHERQNKKHFSTYENIKLSIRIVDPFCKHGLNFYGTKDKTFIWIIYYLCFELIAE